MQQIAVQEAIEKAQAFIAERRTKYPCGDLQEVKHKAGDEKTKRYTGTTSGTYYIYFAYVGPKVKGHSVPRRDHPTVVCVDDETGECSIMMWM